MRDENVLMGKRIASARQQKRWTKAQLATVAGVAPSYITRIEQGAYDRPSVDKVTAIARALGIRVVELTEPVPEPVAPGIEADLKALGYSPDEAPLWAALTTELARRQGESRRKLLEMFAAMAEMSRD